MYKIVILTFAFALLCLLTFGQTAYGLKIGITQSKIDESNSSPYQAMNSKTGMQVGFTAEIRLAKNLYLSPALQFTQKGYKAVEGNIEGPFYWEREWAVSYIEIPLDIARKFTISKTGVIFIGAGPVLGIGLSGNGKIITKATDGSGQMHTQENSAYQPFRKNGYKRIDFGAGFLTGVQIRRILLTASYNHGLTNILNYDQGIQATRNKSFAFTVGYQFVKT